MIRLRKLFVDSAKLRPDWKAAGRARIRVCMVERSAARCKLTSKLI